MSDLRSGKDDSTLLKETRPKFFTLEPIFWIRYSDFMDIVPRHPHLPKGLVYSRAMGIHEHPFGVGGTWQHETTEGRVDVKQKPAAAEGPKPSEEKTASNTVPEAMTNEHLGAMVNGHL